MTRELSVRNQQRRWRIDTRRVRALAAEVLDKGMALDGWSYGVTLVTAPVMARMNWEWLQHEGPTDILTFEHREDGGPALSGECFICVDVAVRQAAEFGVEPGEELMRYVIHGALHLLGHDDRESAARRLMKRQENRWVQWLARRAELAGLVRAR